MKLFVCLVICCCSLFTNAQKTLSGVVIGGDNNQPLAAAVVFVSNTTLKTITNNKGEFTLENLPIGKFDLIITFIGYETYAQTISNNILPLTLKIKLLPKTNLLNEVTVEAYDKDGWLKWGKFFTEHFIGNSDFAMDCILENKEAVKFIHSTKNNTLRAISIEPLRITNKALGYQLEFQLEEFYYNFSSREMLYKGFPLFIEMKAKRKNQQLRWEKNRQDAYYGSIMHFMRALYRNKILEEGFEVRQIKKVKNTSAKGSSFFDVLINKLLPGDSIAHAIDSTTAGLSFTDFLQVTYIKKTTPNDYARKQMWNVPKYPTSKILIRGGDVIAVFSNGVYYQPTNLLSYDYWAWSEKIASLLPTSYQPSVPIKK